MTTITNDINTLLLPRYLLNDIYPYPECTQLEFKKTFHINQHSKYRETICAFLNTNGGHIMFGVLNNCVINGCPLSESEKDNLLLFIDATYTILKNTNGENIPKDTIKVYFEEIAKNIYIIIISCYRLDDTAQYQFLNGDSWVRMNASIMKTNYGKLYSAHDVSIIKLKFHKRYEDTIVKLKKDYKTCERDTIITISNIFENKFRKDHNVSPIKINWNEFNIILYTSLLINIYFLFKNLCV
jgi:predicted HTH transcriptional regulator